MPDEPEPIELVKRYYELLADEGFRLSFGEDGEEIKFKYEGRTFYLSISDDDPEYMRIVYMYFWSVEDEAELMRALRAANFASYHWNVAKVFVIKEEDVGASVEFFVESPDQVKGILTRALSCLSFAIKCFREEMWKQKPGEKDEPDDAEDMDKN
jgi:hypothetical protein